MLTDHSPATRWVDAWRVSGELFCALDFTFLQGEASLPRRVVTALESRRENGKASELCSEAFTICSPDWTRTSNPSINSRMLCQLSYGGLFCFSLLVSLATSNNYTGAVWAPQLEMP